MDIPESLHKALYDLAELQAQNILDGKLQLEPSALSELVLWFLCQNLIFEFSVVVCDLFAAHNQNWATLLQTEGLAPNGVVSTTHV